MKCFTFAAIILASFSISFSQDNAQKIYDTERAFEKMVADQGIRAGFIEYLSPLGIMFFPEPMNGREAWTKRPASPAALTWNPIKIETSANGALAYSIGNSIYRPKGKEDSNEIHGHYLSVWARQVNGEYRAALDTGINHEKPSTVEPNWKPSGAVAGETNLKNTFAGDSSIGFYRTAEDRGMARAYKAFAADDIYFFRQEKQPIIGKDAVLDYLDEEKLGIRFVKRRSFIEAGDLAYVYSSYTLIDTNGTEKEKGSFVQVWKLKNGRWKIAADVRIPIPTPDS